MDERGRRLLDVTADDIESCVRVKRARSRHGSVDYCAFERVENVAHGSFPYPSRGSSAGSAVAQRVRRDAVALPLTGLNLRR